VVPQNQEEQAREIIDHLLTAAGWVVVDRDQVNIHAVRGVAVREFTLKANHGEADYLLYVDGQVAELVVEKKKGADPEYRATYVSRTMLRRTIPLTSNPN